ncbi:PAS domain S-box protein [Marinibaculum pumilum]|uniref:histidine kinase n=1 Tax=Marinibaculum pumilum TaxID=1766165 RepID=A0ABV7L6L3_9PROT
MLHEIEMMDGRSRRLARQAVVTACGLALAGSGFGLAVAYPMGLIAGIELWLVASCALFSAAVILGFFLLPARLFHHVTIIAILYFGCYLSAGILIALYSADRTTNVFVYLVWFFPLLAFNILMRVTRSGRLLHVVLMCLPFAVVVPNAGRILAAYPEPVQPWFVVFGLSYLCFGLILSTLSQYREAFIAERERSEALLGASQILESISDCYLSLDRSLHLVYANGAARRDPALRDPALRDPTLADHGPDNGRGDPLVGRPLAEIAPRMAAGEIGDRLRAAAEGTTERHFEAQDPPSGRWYDIRCFPRPDGLSIYFRNITEAVAIREELRRNEALLRIASRMARIGGWEADLDADMVSWSEEVAILHGASGRLVHATDDALRFYMPDSRQVISRVMARCARTGRPFDEEAALVAGPGRVAWVRIMGQGVADADGRTHRIQGAIQDITERKLARSRLQEQAALLDKAQDAIIVRDLDGHISYWNRGAERLYGWPASEALGRTIADLLAEDPDRHREAMSDLLAQGEWSGEIRQERRDGSALTTEARWTLVRDDNGLPKSVLAIQTDITPRLAVERQLRQSQRLQAVGQLTGGVAHDFNNLLTVILGNADSLAEALQERPRLRQLAEMTRSAAQRGAELTRRLLAFARQQALEPRPTDVPALMSGMEALLRRSLGENVEIRFVAAAEVWPALVDAPQLEAAVLNLCLNARDAMPDGGRLTVETANAHLDRDYADWNEEVVPGDYLMVAVSDTGTGMAPEVVARAFEPFFTTKGVGQGSGLGLSMVFGFAKQSHGHVKIYSEPGQGTTVRLYLPRAAEGEAVLPGARLSAGTTGGTERILLVEDDELVRRHVGSQLEALGYRVTAAASGPEALDVLRTGRQIDLLFTDVVMPGGMDGRQLAEAALKLQPGLPVLFTSGYAENAIVHHGRLDPGVHLLNKPYRQQDLAVKLRQVLDRATELQELRAAAGPGN